MTAGPESFSITGFVKHRDFIQRNYIKFPASQVEKEPSNLMCLIAVVLKPVLRTPSHHIFCMSLSYDTPSSSLADPTELMSWIRCVKWGRHTKYVVVGGPQDRFENHWSRVSEDISTMSQTVLRFEKIPKSVIKIQISNLTRAFLIKWSELLRVHFKALNSYWVFVIKNSFQ